MGFAVFDSMFTAIFLFIAGCFIVIVIMILCKQIKNKHSPRLTVPATVTAKRMLRGAHWYHTEPAVWYYVTFQFESGDRMEFSVSRAEYGGFTEGDAGYLSFQGTQFLSFERR